jgi:hypothetical protein
VAVVGTIANGAAQPVSRARLRVAARVKRWVERDKRNLQRDDVTMKTLKCRHRII